ncbi:MAG: beta-eliminating lyase-related protein [Paracoccaceae bacterium]|nr:beta-eliminating lyase-related protein [Paracoccaceae bacterium]
MHDLYSDTKTKPTRAMREAMLDAPVGDEQKFEDPTTIALEERVADLMGKEAAIFLPSGTMCNQIAVHLHTRPGDEIICDRTCHIVNSEAGGASAFSGVAPRLLDGVNGVYQPDQVVEAIRPRSRYIPRSSLLCAEQTANMGGGRVWPVETLIAVAETAKEAGLATHLDGARLLNAVVASGISARDHCAAYDSCWLDFTKGLGAPVGAVLAGSSDFIDSAWDLKQRTGGSMRQSGVIAAMCIHALDHHVDRLADDHKLAQHIAAEIVTMKGAGALLPVDTNIIIFDLTEDAPDAPALVECMKADGFVIGAFGPRRIRIVTHLDVDPAAGEALIAALRRHIG